VTAEVYQELLRRAELALSWGDSVVLDATWLDPEQRVAARALAERGHAHIHEICCDLPLDEASARISARSAAGGDASDATPEVLARLATRSHAPWPEARHVDTTRRPSAVIDGAVGLVRPER
jgi:hypothetical protein